MSPPMPQSAVEQSKAQSSVKSQRNQGNREKQTEIVIGHGLWSCDIWTNLTLSRLGSMFRVGKEKRYYAVGDSRLPTRQRLVRSVACLQRI